MQWHSLNTKYHCTKEVGVIGQTKYSHFFLPIVIYTCVCWVRGSMIGSYPCTDEGIWAYYSMITSHVINTESELTVEGYINLYPTICSFIFNLEVNPFLSLRIIDLIFTCLSFYMLYLICIKYTDSKLISLLIIIPFIFVFNHPKYIQAGFKNSIIISSFFIYLSFYLFLVNSKNSYVLHYICGISLMLSVLFREFHIFVCSLLFIIYFIKLKKNIIPVILGMVTSFFATFLVLTWIRGLSLFEQLFNAYLKQSEFYKQNKEEIYTNLENSFNIFILDIWVIIPFVLYFLISSINLQLSLKVILNFISFASILMVEPLLKICFPYHLCSIYFIVPIFTSQLHQNYFIKSKKKLHFMRPFFILLLVLFSIYSIYLNNSSILHRYKNNTLPNLMSLVNRKWSNDFVNKSHYLIVSKKIKDEAKPHDTLCVSGYAHVLFPLTGLFPANSKFEDLYYACLSFGEENLKIELVNNSPDIIYLSKRDSILYAKLLSIINSTSLYNIIEDFPLNKSIHYGQFSATLFKLKS